ncbi:MAG: hypothetical protein DCF25_18695 [Leptolyngbya foveolarum]|uniref:CHAT domain-containing protein n=1 Tax=Leptolyngbya foveolarum TaxID=47253 RepID=A0A2W4VYF1_9CYAN|nr:MAG: hypothetical protein DCF25_18695 [Leptolyngbya foveolarum]
MFTALMAVLQTQAVPVGTIQAQSDTSGQISQYMESGDRAQNQEDYTAAATAYQQAIARIESQPQLDPLLQAEALLGLGRAYRYLGEYDTALPPLARSLSLVESLDESYQANLELSSALYADLLIDLFRELGVVHNGLSQLGESLLYYRRGLVEPGSPAFRPEIQAILLHNIGAIEAELDDDKAQATLEKAAQLSHEAERFDVEASAIFTLGWVAENSGDIESAIARYQQSIDIFQTTHTPDRLIKAYGSLAQIYIEQQDYPKANTTLSKAYALLNAQSDPNPKELAYLLNRAGQLAQFSTDRETAWQSYRQALQLSQQIDDSGQVQALLNLGSLLEDQKQPDLAIFFYKQAIAHIETIRQDIQKLSTDLQRSHTQTVEESYRHLADLLLQQNRKAEALQILELLKIQEVTAYLRGDRNETPQSNLYIPTEMELQQRLDNLPKNATLADFIQTANTIEGVPPLFDSQIIDDLRSAITQQPIPTAVLYPIILEDRLEILLITPDGTIEQFETPIAKTEIGTAVRDLQAALKDNILDAKPAAQQLYTWLIAPLKQSLQDQQVENIIYLPDGVLRYVPLAAFHDGNQWLAERYQSHNITAATLGDLTTPHPKSMSVLAGAFADTTLTYQINIGDRALSYSGLSAAHQEIENLTKVANTQSLFDQNFTPKRTLSAIAGHSILHLATHAQFVVGQPEASFILFGSGQTVNLTELRQWSLPDVDLVVLSACQTATSTEGEGKEILGLGYQIQQTGASAVLASLWSVDDTATAALMNQFYIALAAGQSKAQALRTAQQKLIDNNNFSNPHNWAGFILIGNGL